MLRKIVAKVTSIAGCTAIWLKSSCTISTGSSTVTIFFSGVADQAGRTVTGHYLRGAIECARLAKTFGASGAILKDRSPSCGLRKVYVDGRLRGGRGVAAALLESEGLKLVSPAALKKLTGTEAPPRR